MKPIFTFLVILFCMFSMLFLGSRAVLAQNTPNDPNLNLSTNHDQDILIYPNPFNNYAFLRISPDVLANNTDLELVIYNIIGTEVKRIKQINQSGIKIYRDSLPDGRYIYELRNKTGPIKTGRISIN